jgi:uncharacterized protein YbaP (TraB family)
MKFAAALFAAFLTLSCASPGSEPSDLSGPTYVNDELGFRINFPDRWELFTDRGEAPALFGEHLPADKGPNDSPLFIGWRIGTPAYASAVVEQVAVGIEDYFAAVYATRLGDVEVLEAQYSPDRASVRWKYQIRADPMPLIFIETMSMSGPYVIRLGLWTLAPLVGKYEPEFRRIAASVQFSEDGRCASRWKALDATLSTHGLEYVALASTALEEDARAPVCPHGQHNLLWQAKGERNSVYLFGSIHFGKPDFYPLPEPVTNAFSSSQRLVVEIDASSEAVQQEMAQAISDARLEDGQSIQDVIQPHVYEKLVESIHSMGLPVADFLSLKPWALGLMLTVIKMQSLGYLPDFGVDKYLLEHAGEREIISLESAAEQLALLQSLDGETFLAYTILSLNTMEDESGLLINAWRCGDEEDLEDILLKDYGDEFADSGDLMEHMYYDRNRRMADKVETFLQDRGDYFLVVGAGHLVGERGLVALLRERGWEVTRL